MVLPASGDAIALATLTAHLFKNSLRASFHQQRGHVPAKLRRFVRRATSLSVLHTAGRRQNKRTLPAQFTAFDPCPSAKWHLASAMQCAEQRPFRNNRRARLGIVQPRNTCLQPLYLSTGTPRRWLLAPQLAEKLRGQRLRDAPAPAQTVQPRFREHHRFILPAFHFSQTRIHIPAQIAHVQIRPDVPKLRLPPQTPSPNSRALPQTGQRRPVRPNQAVSNIFAPAHSRKHQPRRGIRRNVLDAMHCEINRFLKQRFFQFLNEDSLPADLRE